ncbi:monovalent cation/H+ antiporter subunit D [Thiohalomonas denitrificans]|uniref:Multisubunit potassium/proton antiporter, PhaD subunit n=1 Tax=Thiohalomonas denitrificans TaxID=415747 RepID=A0A1G5Q4J1_9GAMM|nr:multisubunit potassium/proton antiporter, PhaD subunit [Thiohalomonas denitrificans]
MSEMLILPIVVPLLAGALLLVGASRKLHWHRAISTGATMLMLIVAVRLLLHSGDGSVEAYLVGNWPAPFGIVLVLDRLAALMLLLTAILAVGALAYGMLGTDRTAPGFHALFMFQLLGLNGAFLTGDLFNLFVFFEILLLASYGLLLHGGGAARTRAGLHYVVINLVGSSLFLIALGLIYGVTGTLNMAHLAERLATLDAADVPLAGAGALLLLVVFGLKAAVLPLHFWLPHAYGNASAPVAALFAIMTKVGIYAIVRVFELVFGYGDGPLADVAGPWLLPASLLTLVIGTVGVATSRDLREMVGYLIIVSVGMLLVGIGLGTETGLTGSLYYLIHTTLVTGGLFLLADVIARGRPRGSRIVLGPRPPDSAVIGVLFLLGAIAIAGMPPLSGLIGKLLILTAAQTSPWAVWVWATILGSSLFVLVGLTRAGSTLFWHGDTIGTNRGTLRILPAALLIGTSPLLVAFGGAVSGFAEATALQVLNGTAYVEAVLGLAPTASIPQEASP